MSESDKIASINDVAKKLVKKLKEKGYTIATAESCTGGMISSAIVDVPGASWVLNEAYVTYSNEAKMRILGVRQKTLDDFGAVSCETAREMAEGVAKAANAECAIAVTGTAGPDGGTVDKPVGTVYAGFFFNGQVTVERYNFKGDRYKIREATALNTLMYMLKLLENEQSHGNI